MAPNRGTEVRGRTSPHPRTLTTKRAKGGAGRRQRLQLLFSSVDVRLHPPTPTPGQGSACPLGSRRTLPLPSSLATCPFSNRRRLERGLFLIAVLETQWPLRTSAGGRPPEGRGRVLPAAAEGWGPRSEEAMRPWIGTQGGRACLFSQPLVERVRLVGAVSLCCFWWPRSPRSGCESHPPGPLVPAVPSQDGSSSTCLAPWASVLDTVVKGCALRRWCQ